MATFVFLDIDGVLNDHAWDHMTWSGEIHADKVRKLNRLLFCTGAKVVLSSAWRYLIINGDMALSGFDWMLRSHGFHAGRLIGSTNPDCMTQDLPDGRWMPFRDERGLQISEWIIGPGWRFYGEDGSHIVIDDLDLGITKAGHPFIHTDGKVGLTDADVNRAIEVIREQRVGVR